MPIRHFISVDLPAPFSPIKACTVPLRARNWTLLRARTPGNCLEIPSMLSTYSLSIASSSLVQWPLSSKVRQWPGEDLFHERLVVFLGDGLVGNPDISVHHFRIGFFLDQKIGSISSLFAL